MSPARGARMDPNNIHNPFKFIENALKDVRTRISKSNTHGDFLENVENRQDQKNILLAENRKLRSSLKNISGNVHVLIEKMKQQSLKKTKGMFHPQDFLDDQQIESASTVASNVAGKGRANQNFQ